MRQEEKLKNFSESFKKYKKLFCYVGIESNVDNGVFLGVGCVLSKSYILTAFHIIQDKIDPHTYPIVYKNDGCFLCEVAFESSQLDILVLKSIEKIGQKNTRRIEHFPVLDQNALQIGTPVGYMGELKIHDKNNIFESNSHTCFSQAYISFVDESNFFGLSGGMVQQGFSGGPVFSVDAELVGVIVRCQPYISDYKNPINTTNILPIMSPLYPIYEQIQKFLQ